VPKSVRLAGEEREQKPALDSARKTLQLENQGLATLAQALEGELGRAFCKAVEVIAKAVDPKEEGGGQGRVIVTGMGKSGHVGRKLAATFASTGTPASFVHAAEAGHGDLGMVTAKDVVVALSWSGETPELREIIHHTQRFDVPVIAITTEPGSALGRTSDIVLALPKATEACPHGLAPTTSTTMQLVIGDALAIALLEGRGFTASDFRVFHPGGKLGAALTHVRDLMHIEAEIPLVPTGTPMSQAILAMSEKSFGCVGVTDASRRLIGIVTDGDLRRHMGPELLSTPIDGVMTRNPRTVGPDAIASAALEIMNSSKIMALFVVEEGRPVGILHLHDVLRAGVA
jgi:arabinose-5-phosphate isomerase